MTQFLQFANSGLFLYYLISNLVYLCLLVVAIYASARHQKQMAAIRMERVRRSPLVPPISLLVPAHNEEKFIVESVQSLLTLDYPEYEVIVVNDGSTDSTLEQLRDRFQLLETDLLYIQEVPTKTVRAVYMSQTEPRLLVVDKESAGSKADALNAALNAASCPYVCVVDADSILERDALLRIMVPILTDSARVVAAGGIVRVLNGSKIVNGRMAEVRLPRRPIEVLQVVEYLRAFLVGREGWAHFNLLTIISGAFGIFRRDLLRRIGGYRTGTIGEDVDMVMRMHRYMREQKTDYQIGFVPDPVCWTEAPGDCRSLGRQRVRWQQGLLDSLLPQRDIIFHPKYKGYSWVALPYLWVWELLAPVIELGGFFTIGLAWWLGVLSREFFLQFMIFGYAFATLISIGSVLLEEITFRRYNDWKDMARLICYCFFEHFPYRQIHMYWRLKGIWQYMFGRVKWDPVRRMGFQTTKS
jgi:cellulose synthase/poly-beta-1,6-N-acetylglucosamine synthase-like glycosyltransferase